MLPPVKARKPRTPRGTVVEIDAEPLLEGEVPATHPAFLPDTGGRYDYTPYTDPQNRAPSTFNPKAPMCMADTRSEDAKMPYCTQPALVNKAGVFTRCKNHGGKSTGPKNGQLYQNSKFAGKKLLAKLEDVQQDKELADLQTQYYLGVALLQEYISNVLGASPTDPNAAPREDLTLPEIQKLYDMLNRLSILQERKDAIENGRHLTIKIEQVKVVYDYAAMMALEVFGAYPELLQAYAEKLQAYRSVEDHSCLT
jgi:hypothetical protein